MLKAWHVGRALHIWVAVSWLSTPVSHALAAERSAATWATAVDAIRFFPVDAGHVLGQAPTSRPEMLKDPRVRRWWFTMGWGLVIIVTFFAGAGAIVVFSRRYQAYLQRKRPTPTVVDDVWAMHVAPEADELSDDEGEASEGADR